MGQAVKLSQVEKAMRRTSLLVLAVWDNPKGLLILLDRLPKGLEQSLRINRAGDDPDIQPRLLAVRVVLAEVKQELNGVMTYLEVVGISTFNRIGIPRDLVVRIHQSTPRYLLKSPSILPLQRHFRASTKFAHVQSQFCGRNNEGKRPFTLTSILALEEHALEMSL